jgi:HEPN domain-containing protein
LEAGELLRASPALRELACFHYHQAADKALKAVIAAAGRRIPRVHDLVLLSKEAAGVVPSLETVIPLAERLNPFYIEARYPLGSPSEVAGAIAEEASRGAAIIVHEAQGALRALSVPKEHNE